MLKIERLEIQIMWKCFDLIVHRYYIVYKFLHNGVLF
jgi:hypothetical protein